MKLIRCYIENFGGLHQYTVEFNEGLTVIHEPNGFGKTTLAEFIRAMFYGFPRAGKDLSKNLRMKYAPWQGGRYGGYLVFEHEGTRYRIDRSFGDVPKNDTFKLTSEDTHRESRKFTANIGLELFGLDADSFIRSTYMPQLRDTAPLTTDNIRAKLGNLLEDTGDLGSYEKALQKLKDKRSLYEHFRGNGGSIHEAQKKISALQQEIELCKRKQSLLAEVTAELESTKQALALGEGALQHIRSQLSAATTAEVEAALSREYEKLCKSKADTAQALEELKTRYPKGIPTTEALEAVAKR
ncbi:MAG: AAA family ATPase, partial [Oscillospiraceae bacterium]|nr:AAA family ATPase [Oscillospiraceae bacterium]